MAKSKIAFYETTATIYAVDEFPLGGAIARYKLDCCSMEGGRPFQGDPKKNQHLVGKQIKTSCIRKDCKGKGLDK